MKKLSMFLIVSVLFLSACGDDPSTTTPTTTGPVILKNLVVKNPTVASGTVSVLYTCDFTSTAADLKYVTTIRRKLDGTLIDSDAVTAAAHASSADLRVGSISDTLSYSNVTESFIFEVFAKDASGNESNRVQQKITVN